MKMQYMYLFYIKDYTAASLLDKSNAFVFYNRGISYYYI